MNVGIDVGGTKCLGVTVDDDGRVIVESRRPTPRGEGSVPALIDTLVAIATELGASGRIGVGVPGLVTVDGVLRAAPNLDGVADLDVADRLRERLGIPVVVTNDATAATFAEWRHGAGRGRDDLVLVTLGTGIGGGLVLGGRLQLGRHGFAGEFGHMVVDPGGPPCPCGRRGCWERYASGAGLARLAGMRGEEVQAAARDGDPGALAVVDEFTRWIAIGLVNLANALDPELFVLGGGLATGADLYLDRVRSWFRELIYQPERRPVPEIVFAELGEHAGAIGAALFPPVVGDQPW